MTKTTKLFLGAAASVMLQTEDRLFLCSLLASWTEMDGLGCRAAGVLGHFINEDRGDETSFEPGAPTS